jgi:hypothetical protein
MLFLTIIKSYFRYFDNNFQHLLRFERLLIKLIEHALR